MSAPGSLQCDPRRPLARSVSERRRGGNLIADHAVTGAQTALSRTMFPANAIIPEGGTGPSTSRNRW
jgi:transposase